MLNFQKDILWNGYLREGREILDMSYKLQIAESQDDKKGHVAELNKKSIRSVARILILSRDFGLQQENLIY